jgi:septal ring factor EnvC (AmiA/AmiB activator)
MELTLSDAARRTGKGKSTLLRAVKSGKLSARRTEDGTFMVDASELFRAFALNRMERVTDAPDAIHDAPRLTTDAPDAGGVELAVLHTKVAMLEDQLTREKETVDDLRKRLDRADERLLALTHQPKQGWFSSILRRSR